MAYNSDGYIMIDFTEVDFRRTNQTIEGLYKRCVDVIGTNKFILVINANGRTPLPATCSFTNNQYVIDTVIYMFAVSSNDNLFIRRNDVPASDIIDDSSISVDKTWSSNKIDSELDTKADTSALADYQPLLTPVSPVSINAENEISVDLSSKQNVLTPVSPVSIDENDNISVDLNGVSVKRFTYKGNGQNANTITFPTIPKVILSIFGRYNYVSDEYVGQAWLSTTIWGQPMGSAHNGASNAVGQIVSEWSVSLDFDDDLKQMTIIGNNTYISLNNNNFEYTVCYI